ncbi:MmgE/PrpD family protein [Paraburkholderia unamae]|uniref:MmgE/PrpD family protein n=1 Tax=Paraburkholderia unamae TaxID=219649 RepID=A0ACC6RPL6_9BURK
MGEQAGATRTLAAFVARTQWADVPADVRHEAKRALVNYFAVALAGARDPTIEKAVGIYARFRANESASLIGRQERTDMLNAAALNAMSANVFDFDDTHVPTIIHPGAPVAAPLFALAQSAPLSGEQLLLAFVLGVEVACRIGNAVSPEHYQRGWHITSTCGVFGAAAATARAAGLNEREMVWALGNASAQTGGLVETLGTMSKSIGVGNAARNGLLAALLAQQGFSGPDAPLEGERGFLRCAASHPDLGAIAAGLGSDWALRANTYKPYPCGVVLNPVIDACLALHREARCALDAIEAVELRGHPLVRERTDRPDVRTGREAQVCAQHAVAIALARGRAGLPEFSNAAVAEPDIRAFGKRLRFADDASYSVEAAAVTLVLRTGQRMTKRIDAARGSLAAPLDDTALEAKLRDLAAFGGAGVVPELLLAQLWTLDEAPDAADVMRLAQAPRAHANT